MQKLLKIKLMLLLLLGSSCTDEDYVNYLNFYYVNQTKYDFEKIEVFRHSHKNEYFLNKTDTLKLVITDSELEPKVMLNADSISIYYNDTIKKYFHSEYDFSSPLFSKGYQEKEYGKHNNYHDYLFVFTDKDFE